MLHRLRHIPNFLKNLYGYRHIIGSLAKNDLKTRFVGSYLGTVWTFIQPLVIIIVYWFVFEKGFRAIPPSNTNDVPYIIWLVSGMVPWFFFQEAWTSATTSLMEYSYLVKQMVFRVSILPVVKVLSAFMVHLVFMGILFIIAALYGIAPTWIHLQLLYYMLCTFFLVMALSWITSAISLFFRDIVQLINVFMQIGFWATPIVWSVNILPAPLQTIVKFNPMVYIVEGYRDCFVYRIWIWERINNASYFWIVLMLLLMVSVFVFRRLRPHFADVL